jgi:hypothetical protein
MGVLGTANYTYDNIRGIICDARQYNRCLLISEVQAIYETPWALSDPAEEPTLVMRTCVDSGETGSTLTGVERNLGTGADGTYSNSPTVAPGRIQTSKPFNPGY